MTRLVADAFFFFSMTVRVRLLVKYIDLRADKVDVASEVVRKTRSREYEAYATTSGALAG